MERGWLVNQEFCVEHLRMKCLLDHYVVITVYLKQEEAKGDVKEQHSPAFQCGGRKEWK